VKDQGATVVYLDEFKGKDGNPMGVIVRKKDGGYLYTTTDIACAKYRVETLNANRILYFIDSRQHDHLMQAWAIARKAGYVPSNVSLEHEAFGMMLGKDGKPFKTRSGGTVKLVDLLNEAETRAASLLEGRATDLSEEQRAKVIHEVAMGAVKYADLSKNRTTDYIFDWDNMLSFDGNTSPYLQYAYTRIGSIFRKIGEFNCGKVIIGCAQEEKLASKLVQFKDVVNSPTFTILKVHNGDTNLYHIDAYRLEGNEYDLGLDELLDDGVMVVEWPEYYENYLPKEYIEVYFNYIDDDTREIKFKTIGDKYKEIVGEMEC